MMFCLRIGNWFHRVSMEWKKNIEGSGRRWVEYSCSLSSFIYILLCRQLRVDFIVVNIPLSLQAALKGSGRMWMMSFRWIKRRLGYSVLGKAKKTPRQRHGLWIIISLFVPVIYLCSFAMNLRYGARWVLCWTVWGFWGKTPFWWKSGIYPVAEEQLPNVCTCLPRLLCVVLCVELQPHRRHFPWWVWGLQIV